MFFLSVCFVHILYVTWTGMTVCICGISFSFFFFVFVTWPQTHPQYPTQRVPQLVLVLHLPFSKPHWNEQLNPTDVSERPQLKPEEGSNIYIGDPSRLTTDEPPSFSARVCRSLRSSKPFTCHSCLIPGGEKKNHVRIAMLYRFSDKQINLTASSLLLKKRFGQQTK